MRHDAIEQAFADHVGRYEVPPLSSIFSASMRISEGGSGENIIAGIIWYVVKYDSHESEVEATCVKV